MARFDYCAAVLPDEWTVLGVKLRPFSLGHYIKLRRFGCAFVSDGDAHAGLGDLLLGVAVCSMSSHPEPDKDEFYTWWNREPPAWKQTALSIVGRKPIKPAELDILKWGSRIGVFEFAERAKLFNKYIHAHSVVPAVEFAGETKPSGAHWTHSAISVLVSKCGYTVDEAYNAALPRALGDFYRYAEMEGAVTFLNEQEAEFAEQLERMQPNGA